MKPSASLEHVITAKTLIVDRFLEWCLTPLEFVNVFDESFDSLSHLFNTYRDSPKLSYEASDVILALVRKMDRRASAAVEEMSLDRHRTVKLLVALHLHHGESEHSLSTSIFQSVSFKLPSTHTLN